MKPEQHPSQDGYTPDPDDSVEDAAGGGKAIDRTWDKLRDADEEETDGSTSETERTNELVSDETDDFPPRQDNPQGQRYPDRDSDRSVTDDVEEVAGDDPI
jgi:hypothetical protein